MECMAGLAAQQHIVIATVHQPRLSIWALFNKVMLLSEGRLVYYGLSAEVGVAAPPVALHATCMGMQLRVSCLHVHLMHAPCAGACLTSSSSHSEAMPTHSKQ